MPFVNDKVMGEIALDFERNGQIPAANMLDVLQPVVQADRYRRRFANIRDSSVPSGGPGPLQWTIKVPETEMWKVLWADVVNAGAQVVDVQSFVRPIGGGAGVKIFRPQKRVIPAGETTVIVGPAAFNFKDPADECIPTFLELPAGSEWAITLTAVSPPLLGVVKGLDVQIEILPKNRSWTVRELTVIVP